MSLLKEALKFNAGFNKSAKSDKINRKSLSRSLEKAKKQHADVKRRFDAAASALNKTQKEYDVVKSDLFDIRKRIKQLNGALEVADIADASDVIFHPDNSDISYVVDGKECHVIVDSDGNVEVTPWREYKKSKKVQEKNEDAPLEEAELDENEADPPDPDDLSQEENNSSDGWSWDEAAVDDLLQDLIV